MAEKNILAFFKSPEQAELAHAELKKLKLVDSSIDRIDGYSGGIDRIENPLTGDFPGLANITLGNQYPQIDAAVLEASDVSASGLSSSSPLGDTTGRDIVLTAVIEEEDFEQAVRVVEDYGALI
ncbi:hypothetical protein [Paenibacillus protaetiae]|uniref:Uncharacterized protein n=1 Tax=Paenibacillus protaetiae TaxID=2509456 RepID=A0A4P6EVS8_9BACL|nr:hypothetical protein [Paenibacillus protaetiae]QAY66665.1 hypothetical protein ET464_09850 [Paenibacillus protaetiae]